MGLVVALSPSWRYPRPEARVRITTPSGVVIWVEYVYSRNGKARLQFTADRSVLIERETVLLRKESANG